MTKLFTQCSLRVYKLQNEYLQDLLLGENEKTKMWFIHLLNCHLNNLAVNKDDNWLGVPIPWSFKQKFFQGANVNSLIAKGLITKSGYNQYRHFCTAFKVAPIVIETLDDLAIKELLVKSGLKKRTYSVLENVSLSAKSLIKKNRFKFKDQKECPFNAFGIIAGLRNIHTEFKQQTNLKKRKSLKLKLAHNIRCFQAMLARTTSRDFSSGIFKYIPEYIEPVQGCRLYEVGGGYLNLSKELRSYSMSGAETINVDAVKCHITIAHQHLTKMFDSSGLEGILNNEINIPELTKGSLKIAFLSVLNGARIPRTLNKVASKNRFTLQKLILNDEIAGKLNFLGQLKVLIVLGTALKKFTKKLSKWMQTCKSFSKMAKTSENLQRYEREYLKDLHNESVSYQHDGGILLSSALIKLKQLSNILQIELKPMSKVEARVSYNNVLLLNQALGVDNKTVVNIDQFGFATISGSAFPINEQPNEELSQQLIFHKINNVSVIKCEVAKAYADLINITIKAIKDEYAGLKVNNKTTQLESKN